MHSKFKTQSIMGTQHSFAPFILLLITLLGQTEQITAADYGRNLFNRSSFPSDFIFGTGSSAYQYEGAANTSGKGPSIWDVFTHNYPEKIADGSNGDVAEDFYHRYKEDIQIMKDMNTDSFRFSISWSRILPTGKLGGGVNNEGIQFYNNLIDELLSNGLIPFVVLFHWDVPQALERHGGFLNSSIVDDFQDYAQLCFKEFGDRVKHWTTLNEPSMFASEGYDSGEFAPGRCSKWVSEDCLAGNSSTEPYIVGHNLILSHAAAVKIYREKYQGTQNGTIGITLTLTWLIPYSKSKPDAEACQRAADFSLGWFLDPLFYGNYPFSMRHLVGERLPRFTRNQSDIMVGSFDFIGLNYYTTYYGFNVPVEDPVHVRYSTDAYYNFTATRRGVNIGPQAGSTWLYEYPKGLWDVLVYVKRFYNNPIIYVTENGFVENNNVTGVSLEKLLKDPERIRYYYRHLLYLHRAIYKSGVRVKGYFAWSLLDNFEWSSGYTFRFGINYVDRSDNLTRYPKESAHWFKNFLQK